MHKFFRPLLQHKLWVNYGKYLKRSRVAVVIVPSAIAGYYCYRKKSMDSMIDSISSMAVHAASTVDYKKWMSSPVTDLTKLLNDSSYAGRMEKLCMKIQGDVCHMVESHERKAKFLVDKWDRPDGDGGGISCILEDGEDFERAGVNISVIRGLATKELVTMMKARHNNEGLKEGIPFFVCGVSCVIHPRNPHVPSMHFNFRYFEVVLDNGKSLWWYGGGTDLTPNYLEEEDAVHFHRTLKDACDQHSLQYYPEFKKWCDDYFRLTHRDESRGVGGIFFDDLDNPDQASVFNFVQSAANSVVPAYGPIIAKRKNQSFSQRDREWQLLRRGRYVEFNLVHDRGTKFGLATKAARIESILMSLPLLAKWEYRHDTEKDPRQKKLTEVLRNPREWV